MTDNPASESSALVGIEVMAAELTTGNPTNGVDEVGPVKVFKPVLIRVMGVGTTIKVIRRRVLSTFLVTCIL